MSKETAQIRNLLTPMNTLAELVLHDHSNENIVEAAKQVLTNVIKICGELKAIDESQFTTVEFKQYLKKQDSMGDAVYNLSPYNIVLAQRNWCKDCKQNCCCEKQYDQNELHGNYLACSDYEGR